jgi:ubiquinone/menaquinone biosynthesis C-methylase UbiE
MHIGLDLNSDTDGLILEGDMHNTPFDDAQFQFVFIKNTVDKSYDIRRLVREIGRIVRPGGYVFVDQVCGQSACTPLTRTNIQKASNLLRLFNAWTGTKRILINKDISLTSLPKEVRGDASNHSLLAIQL